MSELRKASFIFLLKKEGKKANKVEIFNSKLWPDGLTRGAGPYHRNRVDRFRIRVNGVWHDKKNKCQKYFTKTEIRNLIWPAIHF